MRSFFFGSGVEKVEAHIHHTNAIFNRSYFHTAGDLVAESHKKWKISEFANLNSFEPDYVKDVYTTTAAK